MEMLAIVITHSKAGVPGYTRTLRRYTGECPSLLYTFLKLKELRAPSLRTGLATIICPVHVLQDIVLVHGRANLTDGTHKVTHPERRFQQFLAIHIAPVLLDGI